MVRRILKYHVLCSVHRILCTLYHILHDTYMVFYLHDIYIYVTLSTIYYMPRMWPFGPPKKYALKSPLPGRPSTSQARRAEEAVGWPWPWLS